MITKKAPVQNLAEERSLSYINYELHVRGKEHLVSVSKKMIINKGLDIMENLISSKSSMRSFMKAVKNIREIKLEWNNTFRRHDEEGYTHREFINLKLEPTKYKCLEFLKDQNITGPFTKRSEIQHFMTSIPDSDLKDERIRKEVKYAFC